MPRSSSKPDACSSCREVLRNLQNEGQNDIRHPKNENCSSRLEPLVVRKQFLPEAHDASDWAHLGTGLHVVVPLPSPCLALAPKTAKSLSFRLREDFESDHRSAWSALRRFLAPNIRRTRRRQASEALDSVPRHSSRTLRSLHILPRQLKVGDYWMDSESQLWPCTRGGHGLIQMLRAPCPMFRHHRFFSLSRTDEA